MKKLSVLMFIISFPIFNLNALDIKVNVKADVVIPPCKINNEQVINLDFGDIPVTNIHMNLNHILTKTVDVTCEYYQQRPYVKLIGEQLGGADTHILATNIENFGIAMFQGVGTGTPMQIGDGTGSIGYEITDGLSAINSGNSSFTFTAAPYQLSGMPVMAGDFRASAMIDIIYM